MTDVSYTRRRNLGNYEHEELTISVAVGENEKDTPAVIQNLKFQVLSELGIDCETPVGAIAEVTDEGNVKTKEGKTVDPSTSKEVKEEKKVTKKVTKKAAPKAKNSPYDRSIEAHRQKFAEVVEKSYPGWKKDAAIKAAAKLASETLNGVDLFSGQGKVLASFNTKMKELMEEQLNADL